MACGALHFYPTSDVFEACCKKGDVLLPPIRRPPPYLYYLFTGDDPLCWGFRTHIRAYNCAFAFTSIGYKKDTRIDFSRGVQCFQIHGELFHFQGPLQPASHKEPSFAQLFFYDPLFATNIRATNFPHLDRTVLLRLTDMLTDCNPFITVYKTARERLTDQQTDFRVLLNPQMRLIIESGADRRRENRISGRSTLLTLHICHYTTSYSSRTATLAGTTVYSCKTVTGPVSGHG
jgi:hypothetical protein